MRCYLYPVPLAARRPTYLHETGGLDGNWALDFMCPPDARVLSPVDATVRKLSGNPPGKGELPGAVFGYSLHLITEDGYRWFLTHLSRRHVKVGQEVCRGATLAVVGHWPNDRPRSHLHIGVTSPHGEADAKATIRTVAQAIRLRPV